jgi:hypothetical protein
VRIGLFLAAGALLVVAAPVTASAQCAWSQQNMTVEAPKAGAPTTTAQSGTTSLPSREAASGG